jgi:membrane protease YdiL (CAAX protease family)
MIFPTVMAWAYFVALAAEGGRPNLGMMIAFAIGKGVQFAFPAVYVWLREPHRLRITAPTARGLNAGIGFGLFVSACALGLYYFWLSKSSLLAHASEKIYHKLQEAGCATPARFVLLGVFIALIHSLGEEYYWRWFVFGWLRRYLALPWAVLLASLSFGAHHVIVLAVYFPGRFWTAAVPLSLAVAAGGAVWAWLYERTGSLYATWISHAMIDGAVMVIGYDLVSRHWS